MPNYCHTKQHPSLHAYDDSLLMNFSVNILGACPGNSMFEEVTAGMVVCRMVTIQYTVNVEPVR